MRPDRFARRNAASERFSLPGGAAALVPGSGPVNVLGPHLTLSHLSQKVSRVTFLQRSRTARKRGCGTAVKPYAKTTSLVAAACIKRLPGGNSSAGWDRWRWGTSGGLLRGTGDRRWTNQWPIRRATTPDRTTQGQRCRASTGAARPGRRALAQQTETLVAPSEGHGGAGRPDGAFPTGAPARRRGAFRRLGRGSRRGGTQRRFAGRAGGDRLLGGHRSRPGSVGGAAGRVAVGHRLAAAHGPVWTRTARSSPASTARTGWMWT